MKMEWVKRLLSGDHFAASKLISMIENKPSKTPEIMRSIHPHTGSARIIGFTGPPGVGKSTLVDRFIYIACAKNIKTGVIAIDASSPFTGGALLGDRIRMGDYSDKEGVFIRSMGTRGHMGGLAEASRGAVKILDAFGCDLILVETVGVGQSELDIVKEVDTVIVATMPGTGDYVQTMKAGIMEIADIFVVNKADLPGVDLVCMEIEKILDIASKDNAWRPPVIKTCATKGDGLKDLWEAVDSHRAFLEEEGRLEERRKAQIREEIGDLVLRRLKEEFWSTWYEEAKILELVDRVFSREIDLYSARDLILERIKREMRRPF
nr:methylmalonyl Co-A mutase-associated GTPase MeaB [Desulfobacterales bacterium]